MGQICNLNSAPINCRLKFICIYHDSQLGNTVVIALTAVFRSMEMCVKNTLLKEIDQKLAEAHSIRGAIFKLQALLGAHGGAHLAYTFLLHRNSYIRGDEVSATTMPDEVTKHYWKNGGTNTDPVVEIVPKMREPQLMNLVEIMQDKQRIYHTNQYLAAIIEQGWQEMVVYPIFPEVGTSFYSAFTILGVPDKQKYTEQFYMQVGQVFHHSLKKYGLFRTYFKITDKEKIVLEGMAIGKTTADIASELGLKQRTIELRLQNARKKLRARTTTEAVYKATAYSIIFV